MALALAVAFLRYGIVLGIGHGLEYDPNHGCSHGLGLSAGLAKGRAIVMPMAMTMPLTKAMILAGESQVCSWFALCRQEIMFLQKRVSNKLTRSAGGALSSMASWYSSVCVADYMHICKNTASANY